ncbi:Ger(x)C family spore germination protein [Virgibacillus doumboii]|uniref:Ger(x)C family spore germination protein n=1 Tax=Virgibacillus doumboii TaxID=2697503 RepID=UPI0013DE92A7|nr:Ger(x)C family spore germination protein [Virgibacillus doumboii]
MRSKKYVLFFVLLLTGLIANFGMPKSIIDQILMITTVGYDYVEEDTIRSTVITPTYTPEKTVEDLLYTTTASMVYENREKLNAQASEELLSGKMEVALYNDEMAKRGLNDYIDHLLRDPGIGSGLYLGIVKGSTADFMSHVKSNKGAGIFLSDLLEHNIKDGSLPTTNLKMFSYAVSSKTYDPFLPMLGMKEGVPGLTALAFFDNDKLVETIPVEKGFIFKILYENIGEGQYNYVTEEYKTAIDNIQSTRDVHITKENGNYNVVFDVKFRGAVREYTGKKMTSRIPKIEKDLEKNFKKNALKLINKFQELNIDPLGIEEHVQSSSRSYDRKKFKEGYQDLPIDVKIKFTLVEIGVRR